YLVRKLGAQRKTFTHCVSAIGCNLSRPEVPTCLIWLSLQVTFIEVVNVIMVASITVDVLLRFEELSSEILRRGQQLRLALVVSLSQFIGPRLQLGRRRLTIQRTLIEVFDKLIHRERLSCRTAGRSRQSFGDPLT